MRIGLNIELRTYKNNKIIVGISILILPPIVLDVLSRFWKKSENDIVFMYSFVTPR